MCTVNKSCTCQTRDTEMVKRIIFLQMTINSKMGTVTRLANGKQVQFSLLGRTRDFEWFVSECFNVVRMCDEKRSFFMLGFPQYASCLSWCIFLCISSSFGGLFMGSLFLCSVSHINISSLSLSNFLSLEGWGTRCRWKFASWLIERALLFTQKITTKPAKISFTKIAKIQQKFDFSEHLII